MLQAEGYAIWIDIEKMGKATLDTMTEAIENSAVVLVCMSEKYKQSPNCRTGKKNDLKYDLTDLSLPQNLEFKRQLIGRFLKSVGLL